MNKGVYESRVMSTLNELFAWPVSTTTHRVTVHKVLFELINVAKKEKFWVNLLFKLNVISSSNNVDVILPVYYQSKENNLVYSILAKARLVYKLKISTLFDHMDGENLLYNKRHICCSVSSGLVRLLAMPLMGLSTMSSIPTWHNTF